VARRGYLTVSDPDRPLLERDTIGCCHCQRIVIVKPGSVATVYLEPTTPGAFREVPGAFCVKCMQPICVACEAIGRCLPWERRIEAYEARGRMLRAAGI
jgi:hypothetical protein